MNLIKKIRVPNLLILLMLLSMYPYMFQLFFGFPKENIMGIVFFTIIFLYCISIKNRKKGMPNELIIVMALQCFGWFFYLFMFDDTSYFTRLFFIALTFLAISMLLWKDSFYSFLNIYCKFLTFQGILGVIAFVFVFIGIIQPLMSIETRDGFGYINFYGLTCSNEVLGNIMRVGGFFDEPGAFAFWGVFALLFNKLTFNNQKLEIVLVISLFFTFSAAYFVLLPIYFICFYSSKVKTMVLTLLIVIPLLFVITKTLSNNSEFLYLTVERFSGDHIRSKRFDQSDNAEMIFRQAPIFGQGAQRFEGMGGNTITDNPYEILAKDGIVGYVITYIPLLYILIRYWKEKEVKYSSGILFLDYMQRPFHINEMHYFMLYLFCLMVVLKYGKSTSRLKSVSTPMIGVNKKVQIKLSE